MSSLLAVSLLHSCRFYVSYTSDSGFQYSNLFIIILFLSLNSANTFRQNWNISHTFSIPVIEVYLPSISNSLRERNRRRSRRCERGEDIEAVHQLCSFHLVKNVLITVLVIVSNFGSFDEIQTDPTNSWIFCHFLCLSSISIQMITCLLRGSNCVIVMCTDMMFCAGSRGRKRCAPGLKFLHFHAVFWEQDEIINWHPRGWRSALEKFWIRHWCYLAKRNRILS